MKPRKLLQNGVSPNPLLNDPPTSSELKDNGVLVFQPNNPFDSSMGLTALIILSALFFLGFFSFYVRRCAQNASESESEPEPEPNPTSLPTRIPAPPLQNKSAELSPSVGSALPLVSYNGEATDCVICLSELHEGETVRMIPCCGHVFHPGCVDTWLSAHVSCPLCRCTNVFEKGRLVTVDEGPSDG